MKPPGEVGLNASGSSLRAKTSTKSAKDLRQAAILIAAVVEGFPGAIEDAVAAVPKSAAEYLRRGAKALESYLPASPEAGWEALEKATLRKSGGH